MGYFLKIIGLYVLLFAFPGWVQSENTSWKVEGENAGITIYLKDAPKPNTRATLIVNFAKGQECQPEVALIISHKYDIGKFENRQLSRNNMYVTVGNKQIYGSLIATKYENGLEFGFFSSEDKIKIFNQSGYAEVKFVDDFKPLIFPLDNAQRSIDQARKNCFYQ